MTQQLLSLAFKTTYADEDFIVSACNMEAHHAIAQWPHWHSHALILYGPNGSGKTHLAHIWQRQSRATCINNIDNYVPTTQNLIIENIERLQDERALLHYYNVIGENKAFLLLTSKLHPRDLPFTLPDLRSRLLAISALPLGTPDSLLLKSVFIKLISDRQLSIRLDVIEYIIARMIEPSFMMLRYIVDTLDREALTRKQKITIPFVRELLQGVIR